MSWHCGVAGYEPNERERPFYFSRRIHHRRDAHSSHTGPGFLYGQAESAQSGSEVGAELSFLHQKRIRFSSRTSSNDDGALPKIAATATTSKSVTSDSTGWAPIPLYVTKLRTTSTNPLYAPHQTCLRSDL